MGMDDSRDLPVIDHMTLCLPIQFRKSPYPIPTGNGKSHPGILIHFGTLLVPGSDVEFVATSG